VNKIPKYGIISIFICIFALGIFIGAFGHKVYITRNLSQFLSRQHIRRIEAHPSGKHRDFQKRSADERERIEKEKRKEFLETLTRELDLSPDQQTRIQAILESNRIEGDDIKGRFFSDTKNLFDKTNREILDTLTDNQKEIFEKNFIPDKKPPFKTPKPHFK
jgi:hypothetical protein